MAAAVPSVKIGDTGYNVEQIIDMARSMSTAGVHVAVFPEMCLTGYTCGDLFHTRTLIDGAEEALRQLVSQSSGITIAMAVGLPLVVNGTMYNCAAMVCNGKLCGIVPKTYVPNYNEFYEKRWWTAAPEDNRLIDVAGYTVTFGTRQLFDIHGVRTAIEICEDLWTAIPPSCHAALVGAEIVLNLSASDAVIGKYDYIRNLVAQQSARCMCGYVYASAGFGESSTDLVFDGITMIAANGNMLSMGERWQNSSHYAAADIDIYALRHDRMRVSSFADAARKENATPYPVTQAVAGTPEVEKPLRRINAAPFVPARDAELAARCNEIINIQTAGLAQRLAVTHTANVVIGISGGLDSTLALLVAVKAFDRLGLDRKGIHAITMPGFGTTGRTYRNAVDLIKELGTSFREIDIRPAVNQHFVDISHDASVHDVTYENSQARQRTLLLMDIANQTAGMVVGTGDLSELALGWATYNGDHMSMYGVNAGVPKTLVKYLVEHFATGEASLIKLPEGSRVPEILLDIAATPISPELIPADENDNITQKTEDLVGPYALHDFFLYYFLRYGLDPESILERACNAFEGTFNRAVILHWLRIFLRRFFSQQFKRSCMPDGPKVGSVSLSPRGDWRMPSDATCALWLASAESLE